MTGPGTLPADAPVLQLTLVGIGEPLLRMEKRLNCAASGARVRLDLAIRKDNEALDIPFDQTPAVLAQGQIVFSGLRRTEEIENWLKGMRTGSSADGGT